MVSSFLSIFRFVGFVIRPGATTIRGLVATADDYGTLNLLNYPCVVKNAPSKSYSGHSSHVQNVRFVQRGTDDLLLATVGGHDTALIVWRVEPAAPVSRW